MRNIVPGWSPWSAWSFLFVLPSILRTVEATSVKWLFANQFEEISWNRDADSNSKEKSPWYPMVIHHYPGYHSTFHYNKPLSIKFSSACSWGHNWHDATVNSFHRNVDKVCAFFFFFFFFLCRSPISLAECEWVIVQYIVPTEDTPKSGHVQRAIVHSLENEKSHYGLHIGKLQLKGVRFFRTGNYSALNKANCS